MTWPVCVCALQRSMVILGCDHRMTINCSSHGHVQLLLVRAPSTLPDQHPGTLYPLLFVIRQWHWEPLGRCWNRFCSDWQMCIDHGIRVAARAFVTFVKGRMKYLLLLLLYEDIHWNRSTVDFICSNVENCGPYYSCLQCCDNVSSVVGRASSL